MSQSTKQKITTPVLHPSMDARTGVVAVLQAYWADAFAQRHKVNNPRWIEPVHAMRVDTRRIRTCLKRFGKVLDVSMVDRLTEPLHRLNRLLAPVRDGDVLCKWVRSVVRRTDRSELVPELEAFERFLRRRQQPARRRLVEWIEAGHLVVIDAELNEAARRLGRGIDPGVGKPLAPLVRKSVKRQARRIRHLLDGLDTTSDPERLHDLRRKVRRLRYTLQAFQDLYNGGARSVIKQLVRCQDVLGDYQDCIVHRQAVDDYRQNLHAADGLTDLQRPALDYLDGRCDCAGDSFINRLDRALNRLGRSVSKKQLAFLKHPVAPAGA
ncbi:MAG: CHAD domain-containing protein [Planctomycetota bacterium]